MKQTTGWLFVVGGALLTLVSVALRHPSFVIINGYYIAESWRLQLALGLAVGIVGVVILRRTA